MKKGSMLVEMLIVIIIIPILMFFLARLFNNLLTETPRLWEDVHQNATMLYMLSRMERDIDKATDLPQSDGNFTSSGKLLLIEQEDTLIGYEIDNEKIIRRVLNGTETDSSDERILLIPDAKIEWNVLRKDGKGYAVEVRNHIEYQKGKRLEKKMANAHLYFIGAL